MNDISEELKEIEDVIGDKTRLELKLDMLLQSDPEALERYRDLLRKFKANTVAAGVWDSYVRKSRLERGLLP